jgi:hypothetical protein
METGALWSALFIGTAGLVLGLAAPSGRPAGGSVISGRGLLLLAGAPILLFAISLLARGPFTPGCGLGVGILMGGLVGAAAAVSLVKGTTLSVASSWVQVTAPVAAAHIWFRPTVTDTLAGVALGYLCSAAIVGVLTARDETEADLLPVAGYGILTALAGLLAVHRGADAVDDTRWALAALVLCLAGPLALLVTALPARMLGAAALRLPGAGLLVRIFWRATDPAGDRERAASAARYLFVLVLAVLAAWQAGRLVGAGTAFITVTLAGLLAGVLVSWLARPPAADEGVPMTSRVLAAMVVLAASMVGFQLLAGYGATLAAALAWLTLAVAAIRDDALDKPGVLTSALVAPLLAGLVFAAYRVVMSRFNALAGASALTDHYAVFGTAAGVAIPALVGSYYRASGGSPLVRLVLTGLLCLAAPGLLLVLWGAKVAVALFIGLALSPALLTACAPTSRQAADSGRTVCLVSAAMALAMAQWTGHALLAADLTRDERVRVLAYAVSAIAVLAVAAEIGSRRRRGTGKAESAAP